MVVVPLTYCRLLYSVLSCSSFKCWDSYHNSFDNSCIAIFETYNSRSNASVKIKEESSFPGKGSGRGEEEEIVVS